jgi:hypothetical protein
VLTTRVGLDPTPPERARVLTDNIQGAPFGRPKRPWWVAKERTVLLHRLGLSRRRAGAGRPRPRHRPRPRSTAHTSRKVALATHRQRQFERPQRHPAQSPTRRCSTWPTRGASTCWPTDHRGRRPSSARRRNFAKARGLFAQTDSGPGAAAPDGLAGRRTGRASTWASTAGRAGVQPRGRGAGRTTLIALPKVAQQNLAFRRPPAKLHVSYVVGRRGSGPPYRIAASQPPA